MQQSVPEVAALDLWIWILAFRHVAATHIREVFHVAQVARSKTCENCRVEKPAAQFALNRGSKTGLAPHCLDCMATSGQPFGQHGQMPLKRPGRRPRVPAAHPVSEKVLCHTFNH